MCTTTQTQDLTPAQREEVTRIIRLADALGMGPGGSHNWMPPVGVGREQWDEVVRAHMEAHKANPDAGSMRPPVRPILG